MDNPTTLQVLASAERNSLLALAVHERLSELGQPGLARVVWVIYLGASTSAEQMGKVLGLDVLTD